MRLKQQKERLKVTIFYTEILDIMNKVEKLIKKNKEDEKRITETDVSKKVEYKDV